MSALSDPVRILHVDDEPDFAEVVVTFLEREDQQFEVETATSAEDGLERLDEEEFDCVVSDYDMPDQNGLEFLEAVREEYPDLPFILYTGKGSEEVASDAISAGVTDYLQKQGGTSQYTVLANRIRNAVEKHHTQTELDDREQRLTLFFEQSPLGVIEWDENFDVVRMNTAAEEILGYTVDELTGKSWERIVPESERETIDEVVESLLEGTGGYHSVNENIRKDGERIICEWHNRIVTDDDGEVVAIFSQFQDISEQEGRRTELQDTKERLALAIDQAGAGVWEWNVETDELVWDDNLLQQIGITQEEFSGSIEFFEERLHPDDTERVSNRIDQSLETGEPYRVEQRIRHENGEWIWFDVRGQVVSDTETKRMLGVGFDITERKEREQTVTALHAAAQDIGEANDEETVYETLVETAEEVLDFDLIAVDVERNGYLVQESWSLEEGDYWERTSLEADDTFAVRAYNRQETILVDDLRETDIAPADPEYRTALTIPIGEFGTFQTVSSKPSAFTDRDVEFAELLVGHARVKLTQLAGKRQLRERTTELERQNERLDEFASFVSHDLRNPLNVAKLRLDLVSSECDSEHVSDVENALNRMEHLIDDLLKLARRGETVGETTVVSLSDLVSRCWENVDTKDMTLRCETDRTVRADERRLQDVLENLFRNAVEHGGVDVTVTVDDCEDGFFVADDGDGIPSDVRDRLFESGFSTKTDGTGFGLTIVRDIVEAHGWRIEATESEEGGARFEITGLESIE